MYWGICCLPATNSRYVCLPSPPHALCTYLLNHRLRSVCAHSICMEAASDASSHRPAHISPRRVCVWRAGVDCSENVQQGARLITYNDHRRGVCPDLPYIHILYIYWCLSEPQALRQYANRKGFSLSDHALVPIRNSAAGRGHDKVSDVVSSSQRVHQSKPSLLS